MKSKFDHWRRPMRAMVVAAGLILTAGMASAQRYIQHNLVSDVPSLAARTDSNLVNAWGIAHSPTGPIWIANNGTGTSTVYDEDGLPVPGPTTPLVVTIPAGTANTEGGVPTGTTFNGTGQFIVSQNGNSGSALFLFAGEDGTVSGWNPGVNFAQAILAVDNSASGVVYKGIALGADGSGNNFIYLTDFHNGKVDVYDSNFVPAAGFPFIDPNLPAGYAPFGIANIGGTLFVSYAVQDADKHDDVPGPGNGLIDEYDTSGAFIGRFATGGTLNSPWGMTLAPANFGSFSDELLVGNFGDGHINAFDPSNGSFLGQMANPDGSTLAIDGLWGLAFGNGTEAGGAANQLFFTAGPEGESHGLFGRIQAIPGVAQMKGRL